MLTAEQRAIIDSKGDIKINAVAGSGKTTTLIEYARARPDQKILYLAFNRAVRLEAEKKFADNGITNVRIDTAHSLAYSAIVRPHQYQIKTDGYKTPEIVKILGLANFDGRHTEYMLATHIMAFVSYFCNSDKDKVQQLHYEDVVRDPIARDFALSYKMEISHQTRLLLDKMNKGEIPVTHDFYLKKFALSKPVLYYDTILFDEGQDASPAMLQIFLSQKATKVIVGDSHQQIYGWRYAVNSLDKVEYPCFDLSASFRFDKDIAGLARSVVSWKRHLDLPSSIRISGAGKPGKIKTRAIIARTNTGLLVKAIELLIEKKEIKSVYFEGRIESYTYAGEGASIYDILNLYSGEKEWIRDTMIAGMKDMDELEEYIDNTGDAQLRLMVEVVKEYGKKIPGYIKQLKECHLDHDDKQKADMIFSTVHRCKGMEYDEVTLAEDFMNEERLIDTLGGDDLPDIAKLSEDINLLYVAVTRTKQILYIPEILLPQSLQNLSGARSIVALEKNQKLSASRDKKESYSGKRESYPPPQKSYQANREAFNANQATFRSNKETFQVKRQKLQQANAPWSKADDDRLLKLYQQGKSPKELAAIFQRSQGGISSRIRKLLMD